MKKQVVLATKNKDKLRELKTLMKGSGIKVLSLADFAPCRDVKEDGGTFEANARKKARIYSKHTDQLTLADDSGLMVQSLSGRPGVYSARFAGPGCTYHDNNKKLLTLLKTDRRAKFICVMALYDAGRSVTVVRGECAGRIATKANGRKGFGYDPVFIPIGQSKTFAQLSRAAKNALSHRGKALRAAKRAILKYYINLYAGQ